ncbi:TolC family outer membrane protein [Bermanella marisrubri]|uniref:Outer membrane protein n=1 Tax=Bermanella marisrubri TaxID=207949 RepID=Q1N2L5_9GAMM|nr:TolC family outer membrane protein [Bermanella marisrubri]EAT12392.1 Outer membrane protein [Oceanobacter sp. RED65] [Bermanella marisrubri]QIZ85474.1 TolC family outer membrane protein [Bermanella marisrubri]
MKKPVSFPKTGLIKSLFVTVALSTGSMVTHATDLKNVFEQALMNDPQLAAEIASANANAQSEGLARQAVLPTINLTAETGNTTVEVNGTDRDGDSTSYGIQLSQTLIAPASWYSYGAASATTDQAELELRKAEQSLVVRISEAYFDVLRANASLAAAKAQEAAVKRQLEQTQQRFKVGLIAITEVHEAQAIYDSATVELIAAESQLDIAYESLALLTGERYDRISTLQDQLPLTGPVPQDRTHWEQKALGQNLDVLIAQKAQLAAERNHKSKISEHGPSVNLVGSYQVENSDLSQSAPGEDVTSTYVGVQLEMPLFAGGATWAGQKQAYYQRQAAEKSLEAAERGASLTIRSLYRQLEADVARIKARKQAQTSAQSAMEATQTGYEVGTRNIVEVLQAQLAVFSAQRDYEFARYDYVLDLLKFRQAAGQLSATDIEEVNGWLQK